MGITDVLGIFALNLEVKTSAFVDQILLPTGTWLVATGGASWVGTLLVGPWGPVAYEVKHSGSYSFYYSHPSGVSSSIDL